MSPEFASLARSMNSTSTWRSIPLSMSVATLTRLGSLELTAGELASPNSAQLSSMFNKILLVARSVSSSFNSFFRFRSSLAVFLSSCYKMIMLSVWSTILNSVLESMKIYKNFVDVESIHIRFLLKVLFCTIICKMSLYICSTSCR